MLDPFFILLFALVLDWYFGEPEVLWSRVPHPIVLFGRAVAFADRHLNKPLDSKDEQYRKGAVAIVLLLLGTLLISFLIEGLVAIVGPFGFLLELFVVFVLLAQKSLADHVSMVAKGLMENGLVGGRKAVGMIVGRDPTSLSKSGVCRAAIESLAENFSDGVVAPAFWYAVFGIPGLLIYKMINTADSMIAYKNEKYIWFGRVAAQVDDLANWVPARISAVLIALGSGLLNGLSSSKNSLTVALRDCGLHRSPNAGWPEAAMAGGTGLALGGPRVYPEETVQQAYLNSSGKLDLEADDINHALNVFAFSCFSLWIFIGALAVLF